MTALSPTGEDNPAGALRELCGALMHRIRGVVEDHRAAVQAGLCLSLAVSVWLIKRNIRHPMINGVTSASDLSDRAKRKGWRLFGYVAAVDQNGNIWFYHVADVVRMVPQLRYALLRASLAHRGTGATASTPNGSSDIPHIVAGDLTPPNSDLKLHPIRPDVTDQESQALMRAQCVPVILSDIDLIPWVSTCSDSIEGEMSGVEEATALLDMTLDRKKVFIYLRGDTLDGRLIGRLTLCDSPGRSKDLAETLVKSGLAVVRDESRVRVEQDELGVNRFRRLLRWRRREKMRSLQHTAQSHHLGWWKGAAYRRAKAAIQGADSDSATTTTTGYEKDKTTDNPIVGSRYQLSPTNKKTTDSVLPTIVTRMTPRQLAMNFKRREELVSNLFVFSYLYYSHFLSILCGFDK
eukprot:Selendium_serpulae@DN2387_c0_g1_i1.p1